MSLSPPSSFLFSSFSCFTIFIFSLLLLLSLFLELWSWPLNTRHMWTQCWDSGSSIYMMSAARRHCKDTYSTLDRYQCVILISRPSLAPVFDRLQYKLKPGKAWDDLGWEATSVLSSCHRKTVVLRSQNHSSYLPTLFCPYSLIPRSSHLSQCLLPRAHKNGQLE